MSHNQKPRRTSRAVLGDLRNYFGPGGALDSQTTETQWFDANFAEDARLTSAHSHASDASAGRDAQLSADYTPGGAPKIASPTPGKPLPARVEVPAALKPKTKGETTPRNTSSSDRSQGLESWDRSDIENWAKSVAPLTERIKNEAEGHIDLGEKRKREHTTPASQPTAQKRAKVEPDTSDNPVKMEIAQEATIESARNPRKSSTRRRTLEDRVDENINATSKVFPACDPKELPFSRWITTLKLSHPSMSADFAPDVAKAFVARQRGDLLTAYRVRNRIQQEFLHLSESATFVLSQVTEAHFCGHVSEARELLKVLKEVTTGLKGLIQWEELVTRDEKFIMDCEED